MASIFADFARVQDVVALATLLNVWKVRVWL